MFAYIEEALRQEIATGRLTVVRPESWFQLLGSRYPGGLNRIAWEKVPAKESILVLPEPRSIRSDELELKLVKCKPDVEQWMARVPAVADSRVIWIGDNAENGLGMDLKGLLEYFPFLMSFPQHSYALPPDARWCLNYVMEGELFFGLAPDDVLLRRANANASKRR